MMDESLTKTPEFSKSLSRELEEVIAKQNLLTTRTRRRVLVSLQEETNREEDAEMESLRTKAIEEIINSEKSYLKQLEIVEEFFMKPLQEGEILASQIYANIFGDILGIRQVNKELLLAMETSTDKIGKVFLDLAPYLKFYSTYANDFKTATRLVEEQLVKNKPFRVFMERQESRPEVCKKLNALLITPVQRIPRYKLLLDDIIKNTPRYHPDKENLLEARAQIDSIAWYINDQIKDYENNKIMVDIQKSLQGGLPKIIKPDRKLVKQGNLMKCNKSGGHAQPRYVILFSDMLMYCKFKGNLLSGGIIDLPKTDALEVCCVLPLKHLTVEEIVGKGVFTIKCQNENLILYSPNAEDSDWVDVIQKTIRTLKKNKATLRRESSMFQPMRKPDLIKMRRESLGKIMLMRKSDEAKTEMLKKETKHRSPLRLLTPKKRAAKDNHSGGSPFKLKRLAEEESNHTKSPSTSDVIDAFIRDDEDCDSEKLENQQLSPVLESPSETSPATVRQSPRLRYRDNMAAASPEVLLRKKQKTDILRHTKSLTLGRLGTRARKEKPGGSVFRSPSIYDDTNKIVLAEKHKAEDTMTSYLSGKICPLTPSTKPCNVDHLVKKTPSPKSSPELTKNQEDTENVEVDTSEDSDAIKIHPIAIHDGILNQRKSICTIS